MSLSTEGLGKKIMLGVTRIGFSSSAYQYTTPEHVSGNSPPYFLIMYISHSGSLFNTERMAMKSDDDEAYHGPLNPDNGCKNCTYSMRQTAAAKRAVSTTEFRLKT
jgi:hypothetical protein